VSIKRFVMARGEAGRPVVAVLKSCLRVSAAEARALVLARKVYLDGRVCLDPNRRVTAGQKLTAKVSDHPPHPLRKPREPLPRQGPRAVLRYADAHLAIVDKPSGLTTMRHAHEAAEFGARARRYLPPTLADLLPGLLAGHQGGKPGPVRAVHRIDKETSGLVVFARTPRAERELGKQFRAHTVERRYLALVRGRPQEGRIESHLVADRGDGRRGSSTRPGEGQRAVTHVRVVEELGDFTLVECRLEAGRTHQVRIHLGEQGTPLCGERLYDRPLHGPPLPDASGAKRPMLHAATLGLEHPATGKRMAWSAPFPEDLEELLGRLRGAASAK
jgi:23S rRNA pseudouridine1911/1915/1917 synthase